MDWTKIKTKHFLYSNMTKAQKGDLADLLCLTAHLEKMPTETQMLQVCRKPALNLLQSYFKDDGTTLHDVLKKVLEDVDELSHKRAVSRETSRRYREKQSKGYLSSDRSSDSHVTQQRREEDRREEKTIPQASPAPLSTKTEKPVDNPKMVNLRDITVWDLKEPGKHKIYNQTIKIFQARGWPVHEEFLKPIFKEIAYMLKGTNKPREVYPYYKRVVEGYIGKNGDRINIMARKKQEQDMSIGASNLLKGMMQK